jgi:DNA-binding MarR family transcriptional regulator
VPVNDLADGRSVTPDTVKEDLRRLAEQGLVDCRTLPINREPTRVAVLTRDGKALLDARQDRSEDRQQRYHAGLVKPRELAHDAQLYRLYQAEAGRIEDAGGRIERVVLDYELKRDYQSFLNRADRPEIANRDEEMAAFAAAHRLPIVDDHLELPDLRIEYLTSDGRLECRDLELVTEHYSRGQMSGKARAGFSLYRAAGAGRLRGGATRTGGTPFDPHVLERL